jgi:hypothetical protein
MALRYRHFAVVATSPYLSPLITLQGNSSLVPEVTSMQRKTAEFESSVLLNRNLWADSERARASVVDCDSIFPI